ncbi:MAG: hypothetical protein GEV09_22700 [Pseudonocardiaceae bacterium]|nr:hypothetical protein [Pseudonocardiaceae bacterium]
MDTYCTRCGRPTGEGDHAACRARAAYGPPRYCPECARRMIVQVSPSGWSARCSAHGEVADEAGGGTAREPV